MSDIYIHPSAEVHLTAHIERGAWIGPNVIIGNNAYVGAYSVIGSLPEHSNYWDVPLEQLPGVIIEDRARISEFVTIHSGTKDPTMVRDSAQIHNHSHVAHDCDIGAKCVVGGHSSLAGHVVLMPRSIVSGGCFVHQWAVMGCLSFLGARSFLKGHIPPGELWTGVPARPAGFNTKGLERVGMTPERARDEYDYGFLMHTRGRDI